VTTVVVVGVLPDVPDVPVSVLFELEDELLLEHPVNPVIERAIMKRLRYGIESRFLFME